MIDIIFDMETSDPDDFVCLCMLAGHPLVNLKAVTVTPGSIHQIGVVRWALKQLNKNIPVGAFNIKHSKECVSSWHYSAYGDIPVSLNADVGWKVLIENSNEDTTLITGAPLKNIGAAIPKGLKAKKIVVQGGFAGEGVVPDKLQMEKFRGKRTCATFNLNGDVQSAFALLDYKEIKRKLFVSKNVCHRVYYDEAIHKATQGSPSLDLIHKGLDSKIGKLLHDPLAATVAIDESICTFARVKLFRERGEWGSVLSEDSDCWISIDYDHKKFVDTFVQH